jgi:hypothetical protein
MSAWLTVIFVSFGFFALSNFDGARSDVHIAVGIEVAAILARTNDRVGEIGGRCREWQEKGWEAKKAEAIDAAAAGTGAESAVERVCVVAQG